MHGDEGFYAPLQYHPAWLWAGLGLLLLVACWLFWLLIPARSHPVTAPPASASTPVAPQNLRQLQASYVARIDAVAAAASEGRMPARAAHQELSLLLRRFGQETTGKAATRMTLEELDQHDLQKLARAVATIYPAAFQQAPEAAVDASARAARQAVLEWN